MARDLVAIRQEQHRFDATQIRLTELWMPGWPEFDDGLRRDGGQTQPALRQKTRGLDRRLPVGHYRHLAEGGALVFEQFEAEAERMAGVHL